MAQSRRKQLEKLEIVEAPVNEARELNFRFTYDIEPYDELVIMKNLSIRIGERTLLDALDYVVHRGDKLVIAGPNGTGKSTLLQVLDGAPGVSLMPSGTSTPALPSWRCAAIWHASATGARRSLRTARRFQAASWHACALPSWRWNAPT